jgi:hypothetical protein
MVHLILALLGLVLLYFWLVGHWFARILMTSVLWAVAVAILGVGMKLFVSAAYLSGASQQWVLLYFCVPAAGGAGVLASLPTWHKRRKLSAHGGAPLG